LALLALLLTLAWVGWRFFIAQPQCVMIMNEPAEVVLGCVNTTKPQEESELTHTNKDEQPDFLPQGGFMSQLKQRCILPVSSLLLVALIVLGTLKLNGLHVIAPFLPQEYAQKSHILDTFTEAKLEPPPVLPPEVFINATVQRPGLAFADRDWSKLDPDFVQVVLQIMKKMKERGYSLALLEGYRSPERQDELAQLGTMVTKAKGGQSRHQYGLAVDLAPMKDGKVIISEKDPWASEVYAALGEEAKAAGVTWGGNWSFKDYGHIEKTGSLAVLLQKK
jgi:hypothetical protein